VPNPVRFLCDGTHRLGKDFLWALLKLVGETD